MGDSHQLPDRALGSQSKPLKRHPAVLCFRFFALASPPPKCRVPFITPTHGVCTQTHKGRRQGDEGVGTGEIHGGFPPAPRQSLRQPVESIEKASGRIVFPFICTRVAAPKMQSPM